MYTLAFIGNVEGLMIVLILILLLFGGKKIPELMRGVGRGMGELQKGVDEGRRAIAAAQHEDPAAPSGTAAAPKNPEPPKE